MNVALTVPSSEAVLVEYPGFVRDSDAAVKSLGGTTAISAAAETAGQRETELALSWRGGDPLAHPIVGDRQSAKGLIIRVAKRRKHQEASQNSQLDVTIEARITSSFQFNSLADFQYASCDTQISARPVGSSSSCL